MGIQSKLLSIQTELKAPKNLHNSFGNYNYRNFESICEAVKPFLKQNNCSMSVSDDIVAVGERIYVKATITMLDIESGETVSASAFAREPLEKKGQDTSQITGSTSSYARKYAANGLFLLDDTKDADTDEYRIESEERSKRDNRTSKPSNPISSEQELTNLINAVQGYITKGVLSTEGQIATAQQYIKNRNADGLKRTIEYCVSQTKSA